MASDPRVTVLMSVYNGEKFLREAIDSILSQTYSDFEFVIYDDCSTDSSSQIIQSYNDARIVYRRNAINQGLTKNLADGIRRARGEYVARMDADDIAYPDRIAVQVSWMDAHPEVSILGTPVMYFDADGKEIGVALQPKGDDNIKATLLVGFTLMHPTIMIKVDDLRKNAINYDPAYWCSQDQALYFDCICAGLKFENYDCPLLRMRSHSGSISKARSGKQIECSNRARKCFLGKMGLLEKITDDEFSAYCLIASGGLPKSLQEMVAFDHFIDKLFKSSKLNEFVDVVLVRRTVAKMLKWRIYNYASDCSFRDAILAWRKLSLRQYADAWTLMIRIKFCVKFMISFVKGLL